MNFILRFLSFLILIISLHSAAEEEFYLNESTDLVNKINLKFKASGGLLNGKHKSLPAPTSARGIADPAASGKLFSNIFGVEGATEVFFNDYFSSELSLGFSVLKANSIDYIAHNYSDTATPSKKRNSYMIPLSISMQYHIAPFGAISPYIGGGYQYSFILNKSKDYNLEKCGGPILKLGVDILHKDDSILNFEVKKYILQSKVNYKKPFLDNELKAKVGLNPTVISVGIGHKF